MASDRPSDLSLFIRLRKNKLKNMITLNNNLMLNHVIRAGNLEEVKLLIERGVDINKPGRHSWTPLHMAAWGGQYQILKILIKNGAIVDSTLFDASIKPGWTPLHLAVRKNRIRCAKLLLRNGASVDSVENNVYHPLQIAVLNGSVKMAALLLDHGADINLKFDRKDEFLKLLKPNTPCANFLAGRKLPLLHFSILQKLDKMTELLLNRGADIDSKSFTEETTLMQAVRVNDLKLVELLLAKGANPNDRDIYGLPVLFCIVFNINSLTSRYSKEEYNKIDTKLKIVRSLVNAEANVNVTSSGDNNNNNRSLVFYAAERGYHSIVNFLLYESDFDSNKITLDAVMSVRLQFNLITPDIIHDRHYLNDLNVAIRNSVCRIVEYAISRHLFRLSVCPRLLHGLLHDISVNFYISRQAQSIVCIRKEVYSLNDDVEELCFDATK
ncbi:hypothetical protein KQX54_007900 [Cotesia glomerata]|uniref:Uncharacterized protein n=1 Tax=Cotesia glomerata TaxID=32391 RepID=A0AAV7IQU3_COTGL|nr:hypothetical protein KQX54_007900 [Cotesia glomerata]